VAVIMGLEGGLRGALAEQALTLALPAPDLTLRLRCWQDALSPTPAENIEEIAARFVLPAGYIRQTAATAITQAALDKRTAVHLDDVRHAARALNRQMLDNLAERVTANGGSWHQLVVGGTTLEKLRELERRCMYRERLLDHLGVAFRGSANRGVRALLSGPSGTGKTLAARILAAELGMDLYRVDLASVINKYIGETEKNLHRVLAHAEELDVILLLDEGDALLGQRTDVKSSNDRYANLETNYLLQRLENYQGIVLITTNAAQNIDPAFQRRMDVVVNFVPPQADERWAIWQLHMPDDCAVRPDFLARVAAQCVMTGGQIRNAALLATLLAVSEGSARVRNRHLDVAVRAEYRKAGAVCPLDENGVARTPAAQIDQFIRVIAPV
jgi:SpoVK/Ycf46/Vps4 family AAA+-type ATPase